MEKYLKKEQNKLKKAAAINAVNAIRSGIVIGLGSGTTARFATEELAKRLNDKDLKNVIGIPSSKKTEKLARRLGIPLTDLKSNPRIDLVIDGADEVDANLNLIKGGGGALLREKILAQASSRNIIIVDDSKVSSKIGSKFAVPVEVLPFAWNTESAFISLLGAKPVLRMKNAQELRIRKNWIFSLINGRELSDTVSS
jgi:ribose 5-phosphate isomerase A